MKKLFDLTSLKNSSPVSNALPAADKDARLSIRFLAEHYEKIQSVKDLIGRPPAPGHSLFLWTEMSFNGFTFIPYLVKERNHIDELVLSTYSINKRILLSFMRMVDAGSIGKIRILVADSLKHQRPAVTGQLDYFAESNPDRLHVTYAWNHSKIMLARCGKDHFVIEGSGNWSENSRHEQYLFCNSEELFRFRKGCIEAISPAGV